MENKSSGKDTLTMDSDPVVSRFIHKSLYMLRFILVILYLIIICCFGSLVCLFRPRHPDNTRIFGRMLSSVCLKIIGLRIIIRDRQYLDSEFPCVYIANHQDRMDLFVSGMIIPRRTISAGKKSVIYIPFFGMFYWMTGNILFDRRNRKKAWITMNRVTDMLIKKATSVYVFPEGTRNYRRGLLPFKQGAFKMAIRADVPIVPICISTYINSADFERWHSGTVLVQVLEPVSTEDLSVQDASELSDECRSRMHLTIQELDMEWNRPMFPHYGKGNV